MNKEVSLSKNPRPGRNARPSRLLLPGPGHLVPVTVEHPNLWKSQCRQSQSPPRRTLSRDYDPCSCMELTTDQNMSCSTSSQNLGGIGAVVAELWLDVSGVGA